MKVIFFFSIYLLKDSCKSISVRQKPCSTMENKKLLEKLSQMRKNFVADRVRDKQDLVYVEVMHCHFGLAIKYFHPHLSLWRLQSFYRAFRNMFSVHSSIRLIETHITGWDALQWYALNLPKGFIKRKKGNISKAWSVPIFPFMPFKEKN